MIAPYDIETGKRWGWSHRTSMSFRWNERDGQQHSIILLPVGRAVGVVAIRVFLPARETHLDLLTIPTPSLAFLALFDLEKPFLGRLVDDSTATHVEKVVLLTHDYY